MTVKKTTSRLPDKFQETFSKNFDTAGPSKHLSWRHLEDVLIKMNIFTLDEYILQKTPSRRLKSKSIYSSWLYVFETSSRRFQDVFKKTSRRSCQDVFKTSCEIVFKTSSRRFQDVFNTSSKRFQDVFKAYYQLKLFLVTQFQDVFETHSKRFWDILLRQKSTGGLPRSHSEKFMVSVQNSQEW